MQNFQQSSQNVHSPCWKHLTLWSNPFYVWKFELKLSSDSALGALQEQDKDFFLWTALQMFENEQSGTPGIPSPAWIPSHVPADAVYSVFKRMR